MWASLRANSPRAPAGAATLPQCGDLPAPGTLVQTRDWFVTRGRAGSHCGDGHTPYCHRATRLGPPRQGEATRATLMPWSITGIHTESRGWCWGLEPFAQLGCCSSLEQDCRTVPVALQVPGTQEPGQGQCHCVPTLAGSVQWGKHGRVGIKAQAAQQRKIKQWHEMYVKWHHCLCFMADWCLKRKNIILMFSFLIASIWVFSTTRDCLLCARHIKTCTPRDSNMNWMFFQCGSFYALPSSSHSLLRSMPCTSIFKKKPWQCSGRKWGSAPGAEWKPPAGHQQGFLRISS